MKISEYFEHCKLFPLMGVDSIDADTATMLDTMMMLQFGLRSCGSLITRGGTRTDPSTITEAEQTVIAKMVLMKNKESWQTIFDFADEKLKPWVESQSVSTTKYGKVVAKTNEGKDSYNQTDKIAGFDSTEFSDNAANEHETTYGKKTTDTNEGEDTVTVESRNTQAERLVDYTTKFWIDNGLCNRLIGDAIKTISLPLYESED